MTTSSDQDPSLLGEAHRSPYSLEIAGGLVNVPETFILDYPDQRRFMGFDEIEADSYRHRQDMLPLYMNIDFAQPRLEVGFVVVDAISAGHMELGLCDINPDGTYNRYSGGRPLRQPRYGTPVVSPEVFVRIGDFDPRSQVTE